MARGFSQKEGIDYEETFAFVARYTSIRTIMALATKTKWKLHQMDVKTTFLNGVIKEVYIEQPQGFEFKGRKTHVYKLKKVVFTSIWCNFHSVLVASGMMVLIEVYLATGENVSS